MLPGRDAGRLNCRGEHHRTDESTCTEVKRDSERSSSGEASPFGETLADLSDFSRSDISVTLADVLPHLGDETRLIVTGCRPLLKENLISLTPIVDDYGSDRSALDTSIGTLLDTAYISDSEEADERKEPAEDSRTESSKTSGFGSALFEITDVLKTKGSGAISDDGLDSRRTPVKYTQADETDSCIVHASGAHSSDSIAGQSSCIIRNAGNFKMSVTADNSPTESSDYRHSSQACLARVIDNRDNSHGASSVEAILKNSDSPNLSTSCNGCSSRDLDNKEESHGKFSVPDLELNLNKNSVVNNAIVENSDNCSMSISYDGYVKFENAGCLIRDFDKTSTIHDLDPKLNKNSDVNGAILEKSDNFNVFSTRYNSCEKFQGTHNHDSALSISDQAVDDGEESNRTFSVPDLELNLNKNLDVNSTVCENSDDSNMVCNGSGKFENAGCTGRGSDDKGESRRTSFVPDSGQDSNKNFDVNSAILENSDNSNMSRNGCVKFEDSRSGRVVDNRQEYNRICVPDLELSSNSNTILSTSSIGDSSTGRLDRVVPKKGKTRGSLSEPDSDVDYDRSIVENAKNYSLCPKHEGHTKCGNGRSDDRDPVPDFDVRFDDSCGILSVGRLELDDISSVSGSIFPDGSNSTGSEEESLGADGGEMTDAVIARDLRRFKTQLIVLMKVLDRETSEHNGAVRDLKNENESLKNFVRILMREFWHRSELQAHSGDKTGVRIADSNNYKSWLRLNFDTGDSEKESDVSSSIGDSSFRSSGSQKAGDDASFFWDDFETKEERSFAEGIFDVERWRRNAFDESFDWDLPQVGKSRAGSTPRKIRDLKIPDGNSGVTQQCCQPLEISRSSDLGQTSQEERRSHEPAPVRCEALAIDIGGPRDRPSDLVRETEVPEEANRGSREEVAESSALIGEYLLAYERCARDSEAESGIAKSPRNDCYLSRSRTEAGAELPDMSESRNASLETEREALKSTRQEKSRALEVERELSARLATLSEENAALRKEMLVVQSELDSFQKRFPILFPQLPTFPEVLEFFASSLKDFNKALEKCEIEQRNVLRLTEENNALNDKLRCFEGKSEGDDQVSNFRSECCKKIAEQVRDLKLQIVDRNSEISELTMRLESGNDAYYQKCLFLEENKKKVRDLKKQLANVQRQYDMENPSRRYKMMDQAVQTAPNEYVSGLSDKTLETSNSSRKYEGCSSLIMGSTLKLSGQPSGIVMAHKIREQEKVIEKLEKDKLILKRLCSARALTIKELKNRIETNSRKQPMVNLLHRSPLGELMDFHNRDPSGKS